MGPAYSGASATPDLKSVTRQRSFGTLRSVSALVLREMATSYGKSPGGYIWALLEPIAGIALMTMVFSVMVRSPPLGINFPIFYATGMMPFVLYQTVSSKMTAAIMFSRPLLVYPSVTFVDALIARFVLNFLTELLVSYIVFTGICLFFETRTSVDLPAILLGFSMAGALAIGIGTMNCFLVSMFPLWQRAWSILTTPLLIVSCIFFTFDTVPEPARSYLWYNPIIHIVGQMRSGFYVTYDAPYVSPLYIFGLALVLTTMGLVFLRRYHRVILNP